MSVDHDGRVLEGYGLTPGPALVRALLRVVHLRHRQLADPAHGHPADRHVERPLQLQHPRLLLRRRHDLQQGEVHVLLLLVQPGGSAIKNFRLANCRNTVAPRIVFTPVIDTSNN